MSEVRLNIAYGCRDLAEALKAGLNGFGAILLAESYGDDPAKFPLGGVLLVAETHSRVPGYVTVSLVPPELRATRWQEIALCMATRGKWTEQFVILDDDSMPDAPPERFVRTNCQIGLTDADADRAIAILKGVTK